MKKIILLLLASIFLFAEEIEVTAKKFEANEKKLLSIFSGNVVFKRGSDIIKANRVYIYLNKKKKPIKVVALGGVDFTIKDKSGKLYRGYAKKMVYFPLKREYDLSGDVKITQYPEEKKVFAQQVVLDLLQSHIKLSGSERKPVKMIFKLKEGK
jgi:lipopolysaccharide export system protein LptA